MEILDIVDEGGEPTGRTAERETVHRLGLLHRTSHVWIARRTEGGAELLLQKRSRTKDSFPGCWDISSAGHIPAGSDYVPSALRELREELGEEARAEELRFMGMRRISWRGEFRGLPFLDEQVTRVYLLERSRDADGFRLQASEIEAVRWLPYGECLRGVRESAFPTCIVPEELLMLAPGL